MINSAAPAAEEMNGVKLMMVVVGAYWGKGELRLEHPFFLPSV